MFISFRQKAEEEMKTFLDEESHKSNFFFNLRDLGKNVLLIFFFYSQHYLDCLFGFLNPFLDRCRFTEHSGV